MKPRPVDLIVGLIVMLTGIVAINLALGYIATAGIVLLVAGNNLERSRFIDFEKFRKMNKQ